jgi:hypothetical protein
MTTMSRPSDREQIDSLIGDLSDDIATHKKAGLARAEKLAGRRKSNRARKIAQARWNARHGKRAR